MRPRGRASSVEALVERQARRWETELRWAREDGRSPPTRRLLITVSSAMGAGGEALAADVARMTGFQLMDRELLEAIANDLQVQSRLLEPLDEQVRRDLDGWIEGILDGRVIHSSDYQRALTKVIATVMTVGKAVIVGRGAGILVGPDRAFRLRVVAPWERRLQAVVEGEGVSEAEGRRLLRENDAAKADYIKHNFGHNIDDPTLYDLILNLDRVHVSDTAELVLLGYGKKERRV